MSEEWLVGEVERPRREVGENERNREMARLAAR